MNLIKALVLCVALGGCSSSNISTAYKTETAIDASVVTAWSLWQAYVQATPTITLATQQQVSAAFQKVQAAELVALDATAIAATSTNAASAAGLISADEAVLSQDMTDLTTLLTQFGIKL